MNQLSVISYQRGLFALPTKVKDIYQLSFVKKTTLKAFIRLAIMNFSPIKKRIQPLQILR
jgi:hypothetical protein